MMDVNTKLEIWRDVLESKGLVGQKKSTWGVSLLIVEIKMKGIVKLDGQGIPKVEYFWYLGSIIYKDWRDWRGCEA